MLPILVVMAFGRGRWIVPILIPVLLLWPLALIPIAHGLVARDARGFGLLKVIAATRGLRIAVRGGAGERFLIRVM